MKIFRSLITFNRQLFQQLQVNGLNLTSREYTDYEEESMEKFKNMTFEPDTHFYELEVNTTHSSVHVPTNVYDEGPEEWEFIQWSEILDEVFTQNYQSDPALSWQYFGSNLGIMRHFPAMSWQRNKTDTYDCRKRSWYIETATCSKDVVLLLDNSGSMTGFRSYIARYTIKSLLGTFSNNDYFNILKYSKTTSEVIPCFKDELVQATPDNINAFNEAIKDLVPEQHANITVALEAAFTLLAKYREIRNCSESKTGCNQAIMLITDGVPGNATEIFQKYNEYGSNQTAPVRVFTYLLGKEVTKVKEIQLYACLNRGYYSHIQTLDEVAAEVLKYVNVIAAPLVLQKKEHPPTWTHAYIGEANQTDTDKVKVDKTKSSRLMIAVGVPAYNQSSYGEGNFTGRPKLLGVAGTDIPLSDIDRMALPYKLGVNGYAFIISNNGYVLLHPDLRPIDPNYPDRVKENYNSMDLTEVEQFMADVKAREPCPQLLELRNAMVMDQTNGSMLNVPVKFHFDQMRRVKNSSQDFYYSPIPHTPFTLGIGKKISIFFFKK
jgi:voltage-dependent calcium channel alpha-2/delta-4